MNKGPVAIKILKSLLLLAGGLASLLFLLTVVFYLFRNQVGEKVLLRVNDLQHGKVQFSRISFSPFIHFPHMSVKLHDVLYTWSDPADTLRSADTLATLGNVYVAADALKMLTGKFVLSRITMEEGRLYLHEYPDSTINLLHATGFYDIQDSVPDAADTGSGEKIFELSIDQVYMRGMEVFYSRIGEEDTFSVRLNRLRASLNYENKEVTGTMEMDAWLAAAGYLDILRDGLPFQMETSFHIQPDSGKLLLQPSQVNILDATFNLEGSLVVSEQTRIDMSVAATDKDLEFFKLLLSEDGKRNLRSGSAYLSGSVSGVFDKSIPHMDFSFGVKDVKLFIPRVQNSIAGLGLEGSFHSGTKPDFSESVLVINTLDGELPGGRIAGNLSIRDFTLPAIMLFLEVEADVSGFDDVFRLGQVSSLDGRISLVEKLEGTFNPDSKSWKEKENESIMRMDSVCMDLAGFGRVEDLGGILSMNHDTLVIQDLGFVAGNSDFIVNGEVSNLLSLFAESDSSIVASLAIVCDTFDLPQFLSFDPSIGESFPYRITGVDMHVRALTTRNKLLDFETNPEIEFRIDRLKATVENLFPEVAIGRGTMLLSERDERTHLAFDGFSLEVAGGNVEAGVTYRAMKSGPDHLVVDAEIAGLDPGLMFFSYADSIPPVARGILNTSAHADLELSDDSVDFKRIFLDANSLLFLTREDTLDLAGFVLEASEVSYSNGRNPFEDLSASLHLMAGKFRAGSIHLEDVAYSVDAVGGLYAIYPEKVSLFGKEGVGVYEMRPFADSPDYKARYRVENFRIENLLQTILDDTVLTGPMDIDLDLTLSAPGRNELLRYLNGTVRMSGRGMTIYGIDLDNLVTKYNRSQKFNLVDVGAVALAGPAGLALTKGSQFANLAIGSFGKSTAVTEMISDWSCMKGRFVIEDVAFTTEKILVAANGWIDVAADSLDITIAILDRKRCVIVSQSVSGKLDDPEVSEVDVVGTVLGPVTNLLESASFKDCRPFYKGRLNHPDPGRKK